MKMFAALSAWIAICTSVANAQAPRTAATTQQPTKWKYSVIEDAITATNADFFQLRGTWVNGKPGFPYNNAIPELNISCTNQTVQFTALVTNVVLAQNTSIDFRIDDKQGQFEPKSTPRIGDKLIFLRELDFTRLLRSHIIILRVSGNDTLLTMRFDMPDSSMIFAKCRLAEDEQRETARANDIEERRLMGFFSPTDYAFHGLTIPVPTTASMSVENPETLHVFAIGTMEALHGFFDTALRKNGWTPANDQGNCWKRAANDDKGGGFCILYVTNGADLTYQAVTAK